VTLIQVKLIKRSQCSAAAYIYLHIKPINSISSIQFFTSSGFQDPSALFRHEVAYVLGQMQRPSSVTGLVLVLRDLQEHRMVRHEAAEALGAIGGDLATKALQEFQGDDEVVVQESCEVALDIVDHWAGSSSEAPISDSLSSS
jgi:hypothetical protein